MREQGARSIRTYGTLVRVLQVTQKELAIIALYAGHPHQPQGLGFKQSKRDQDNTNENNSQQTSVVHGESPLVLNCCRIFL